MLSSFVLICGRWLVGSSAGVLEGNGNEVGVRLEISAVDKVNVYPSYKRSVFIGTFMHGSHLEASVSPTANFARNTTGSAVN